MSKEMRDHVFDLIGKCELPEVYPGERIDTLRLVAAALNERCDQLERELDQLKEPPGAGVATLRDL